MGGGRDKTKPKLKPLASLFIRQLFRTFKLDIEFDPEKNYSNGNIFYSDIYGTNNYSYNLYFCV